MKKIYLLAFVLFATSLAFAQGGQGQGGRRQFSAEEIAKRTTNWMKSELNLSENQVAPVDSVNLLYAKAQMALMQSANGDREKIREAMTDLAAKKTEALSAILTTEQMELYKKRMSERGNRMGGPRGNNT